MTEALHAPQPSELVEHFLAEAISNSPQPLKDLAEFLSNALSEDDWKTADRLLLALALRTQAPDSWRPVKAKWAGDRSVLGVGWDVEVLKSDPIPGEIIDGHQLSRILARTACWIRCWPEGRDYPMYRSCDLADLDLSDADFDHLAALRPQTAESGK